MKLSDIFCIQNVDDELSDLLENLQNAAPVKITEKGKCKLCICFTVKILIVYNRLYSKANELSGHSKQGTKRFY